MALPPAPSNVASIVVAGFSGLFAELHGKCFTLLSGSSRKIVWILLLFPMGSTLSGH
jgi:hypothetical protein